MTHTVHFEAGESRSVSFKSCDYMIAKIDENTELYAEILISGIEGSPFEGMSDEEIDIDAFDDYAYPILKEEILKQAAENGISEDELEFYWD